MFVGEKMIARTQLISNSTDEFDHYLTDRSVPQNIFKIFLELFDERMKKI